jgi:LPS-assembly protein
MMIKNILSILYGITLIILLAASVSAAQIPPFKQPGASDEEPVEVKADRMSYDQKNNVMIARGNVEMRQGERILNAQYLKVNLVTKDAVAKGNVLLNERGDTLACAELKMNLDDRRGQVDNARVFIKSQNFYIDGKQIQSLGQDAYHVEKGVITTCDGDNPFWRIDAKKIDVTLDGYAKVQGSTFRVKGVPVAYFPYLVVPVKTNRQSGFLFPEISNSRRKGFQVDNSYFWAISPSSDATFWLDIASIKGPGAGIETRLVTGSNSWLRFYSYYANESHYYFNKAYSSVNDRSQQRGELHLEGEHYFSPDLYLKGFGSYITDREFYNDYSGKANRTKYAFDRATNLKRLEKDESFLFANKNWDFYNLLVNFDVYKDLVQSNEQVLQRSPQINFSSLSQQAWNTPLYYQLNTSYSNFWREQGLKGSRLNAFPKLSLPMNRCGWLTFNPQVGLQGTSYFGLNHNAGYDKNGIAPNANAELYLTFLRVFDINKPLVDKLKHVVEPGIEYQYTPVFNQKDLPQFDIPEAYYPQHSISYAMTNRFTGLFKDNSGELSEREFGYFKVGQKYYLRRTFGSGKIRNENDAAYDYNAQFVNNAINTEYLDARLNRYSDVFSELRVNILAKLYFKTKSGFNPHENNLSYYNALVTWENLTGEFLDLEYRYERDRLEQWDAKGKFKLFDPVYCFFDSSYNLLDSEKLDNQIGFDYRAQCWGAKLWYQDDTKSGGQKSDSSIRFTFYLRGMGDTQKEKFR